MKKPKTQEQLDREADRRLQRTYGRGLDWYNRQFELQGGGCAVCGDGPGTRRLHVDHDHRYVDVRIVAERIQTGWLAHAEYAGLEFIVTREKRNEAIRAVREQLKTVSVRSLLCHRCNRAMILFRDRPDLLIKAAQYLTEFQAGNHKIAA